MPLADGCLAPSGDRWGGKIGVVSPKDTRADCATAGLRRVSRGGRRASARVGRRPDLESWREVAEGRRRASVYRAGPPRIHVCGRLSSDLEKISKCWAGARARVGRRPSVAERRRGRRRKALVEPVEMSRVPRPCDRRLPFGRPERAARLGELARGGRGSAAGERLQVRTLAYTCMRPLEFGLRKNL